jgi:hypothetical protein
MQQFGHRASILGAMAILAPKRAKTDRENAPSG